MSDEQLLLSAVRQMTGQSPPAHSSTAEMMNRALTGAAQAAKAAYGYAQRVEAERDAAVAQRDELREAGREAIEGVEDRLRKMEAQRDELREAIEKIRTWTSESGSPDRWTDETVIGSVFAVATEVLAALEEA